MIHRRRAAPETSSGVSEDLLSFDVQSATVAALAVTETPPIPASSVNLT
jgi:hypothetical protein